MVQIDLQNGAVFEEQNRWPRLTTMETCAATEDITEGMGS